MARNYSTIPKEHPKILPKRPLIGFVDMGISQIQNAPPSGRAAVMWDVGIRVGAGFSGGGWRIGGLLCGFNLLAGD